MPRENRRKRNAGREPLSRRPTRSCSDAGTYPVPAPCTIRMPVTRTVVVPMLEELADKVRPDQLESVRRQVRPGEHVAVYAALDGKGRGRLVITGPERAFVDAPESIDDRWILCGEVEISDDGERSLPIATCGRAA